MPSLLVLCAATALCCPDTSRTRVCVVICCALGAAGYADSGPVCTLCASVTNTFSLLLIPAVGNCTATHKDSGALPNVASLHHTLTCAPAQHPIFPSPCINPAPCHSTAPPTAAHMHQHCHAAGSCCSSAGGTVRPTQTSRGHSCTAQAAPGGAWQPAHEHSSVNRHINTLVHSQHSACQPLAVMLDCPTVAWATAAHTPHLVRNRCDHLRQLSVGKASSTAAAATCLRCPRSTTTAP